MSTRKQRLGGELEKPTISNKKYSIIALFTKEAEAKVRINAQNKKIRKDIKQLLIKSKDTVITYETYIGEIPNRTKRVI
jgi:hypothetical protein